MIKREYEAHVRTCGRCVPLDRTAHVGPTLNAPQTQVLQFGVRRRQKLPILSDTKIRGFDRFVNKKME